MRLVLVDQSRTESMKLYAKVEQDRYLSNRNIANKKISIHHQTVLSHSNRAQYLDATQIGPKGLT